MASDDRHERLRRALTIALAVFLTRKNTTPGQHFGREGSDSGRARKHGDDGSASIAMVAASNTLGKSTHDRISPKRRGLQHPGK